MERITGFEAGSLPTTPSREITLAQNMSYVVGGETLPSESPKLVDLPEFQGIKNKNYLFAMQLLDQDAMIGLTLQQKRQFFIFYAWQKSNGSKFAHSPFGISPQGKNRIIESVNEEFEIRYKRFLDIIELRKFLRSRNQKIEFTELDIWVLQSITQSSLSHQGLISNLPAEFWYEGISNEEMQSKIEVSLQKINIAGEKVSKTASRKVRTSEKNKNLKPKQTERKRSKDELLSEVFQRTGKTAKITEFDMWVYENWFEGILPSTMVRSVPEQLVQDNLTKHQLIRKIQRVTARLRRYGIVDISTPLRRQEIRRRKVERLINDEGLTPISNLQDEFEVSLSAILKDLQALRESNKIPPSGRLTRDEKLEAISEIKRIVEKLEAGGRSYANGDIRTSEIGRHLGWEAKRMNDFIMNNRDLLGLPKRKNRYGGKGSLREFYKQKLKEIMIVEENHDTSYIHGLLRDQYPELHLGEDSIRKMRAEIWREMQAAS